MSLEDKIKNAKPVTWLTDGLSEKELMLIKFKIKIYLFYARIIVNFKELFEDKRLWHTKRREN